MPRAAVALGWLLWLGECRAAAGLPRGPGGAGGGGEIGAPPFSHSLDQAVPCPEGSQDYELAALAAGHDGWSPAQDPDVQKALADATPLLLDLLPQLRSPSAGVLVVQNGSLLLEEFVGSRRAGGGGPAPGGDDGFLIGSITKTFTSAMLYKLRDEGRLPPLGVDTPLQELLPNFKINTKVGGSVRGITLRAIAMHASGLPRETPDCDGCGTEQILPLIAELEVLSAPWQATHYSNLGLALLGRALELVANKTWERYVAEDILAPLGMASTGNPPWLSPEQRARMADGVDPDTQKVVELRNATAWDDPCGSMYSTPNDMAIWMSFLMDAGSEEQRRRWAAVLSPETRAEMRNTGILQGDGISAIGAGTFETAFFAGTRWGANKLGCVDGYRTSITMVPTLALGVFGVATSTCDLLGDGDAVSFPVVSMLVPVLEAALARRARAQVAAARPAEAQAMQGTYCGTVLRLENVTGGTPPSTNVAFVARAPAGSYSFVLQFLGMDEKGFRFRKVMGPERWLPREWPGCSQPDAPGENLCPISCFRMMGRGSGDITVIRKDPLGRYVYEGCTQQAVPTQAIVALAV